MLLALREPKLAGTVHPCGAGAATIAGRTGAPDRRGLWQQHRRSPSHGRSHGPNHGPSHGPSRGPSRRRNRRSCPTRCPPRMVLRASAKAARICASAPDGSAVVATARADQRPEPEVRKRACRKLCELRNRTTRPSAARCCARSWRRSGCDPCRDRRGRRSAPSAGCR